APTLDLEWNKRQVVDDQPEHSWFNNMVSATKDPLTFNELMATPIDFSKYTMNRLKIVKLTKAYLVGSVYKLLKGTCKSSIELEYNMEESSRSSNRYCRILLQQQSGISKIIRSKKEVHYVYHEDKNSKIVARRADRQLYKLKEGDFVDLHLNDIEDILLLVVQQKLFQLDDSDIVDFIVALRMFTRSLVIKRRVEDVQLGFSDRTLKTICDELHNRLLNFRLGYNDDMPRRKWSAVDKRWTGLMVDLIDKKMLEWRIIRNLE
ncbi:hypothetical protein Tco_0889469, partial [Tanacetum coccineum]